MLPPEPAKRVAIVTCMDCRIDPLSGFGLGLGEAHVLRNAGGIVTDDVLRSLRVSQTALGTVGVQVVQHTGCGMQGADPALGGFTDLEQSVRDGVARIRADEALPCRDDVRGFVYDVESGELRAVDG